jgi:hypothetical protein
MILNNIKEKVDFYKSMLKENEECYVIHTDEQGKKTPLFVKRSESADSGFFELNCTLFKYTYTKGNASEEKFMREQGYVTLDGFAYDIQTPFVFFEFDKYLGNIERISKKDCVLLMRDFK